jgi:hypothetical protein
VIAKKIAALSTQEMWFPMQGDIMRYLLNLLETELSQPATQLYPHNLAGILETAIRYTRHPSLPSLLLNRDVYLRS